MNSSEKEALAEIVDVIRDALDYLEEGRISIGVEYVKIAKRRANILRRKAEKIPTDGQ
ncbi:MULTISPECIES: hypothetical protein [Klebsiella/Raoultella group]|uniref:hypothetical protein n=1 Tax=Klebsiella/Raoultella group TaxID=2890311 RepID=UPI000A854716|nr:MULTISPECIES: hypothetical protein [Klebsiella/Raoultella group]ELS4491615.1 hypothetical protein [Klebsiella michiganensis]ELS4624612.1 hypothetical protein [Klebsiella michiganensis]MCJ2272695.1 hypothetical protein [Klebsiella oxytoca]MDM4113679.1 hypothetical protein [Klebsiella michiganensis]MDM4347249.1 hypothetical protein [Klebsiella michiganensis]